MCSRVEMVFKLCALICQEVDKSSLFYEVVFFVEANILKLIFCESQMSHLLFLNNIGPLTAKLLGFISRVNIVEYCEFGTGQPGKVTCFNVTQIEGEEELVMEEHTTNPFVVRPATKT